MCPLDLSPGNISARDLEDETGHYPSVSPWGSKDQVQSPKQISVFFSHWVWDPSIL